MKSDGFDHSNKRSDKMIHGIVPANVCMDIILTPQFLKNLLLVMKLFIGAKKLKSFLSSPA